MAVCHSFCIYFLFCTIDTFIRHSFINIRWGPFPCLHSCRLCGRNLHWVPSRDSNSGLLYRQPAYCQLSHATPLNQMPTNVAIFDLQNFLKIPKTMKMWKIENKCTKRSHLDEEEKKNSFRTIMYLLNVPPLWLWCGRKPAENNLSVESPTRVTRGGGGGGISSDYRDSSPSTLHQPHRGRSQNPVVGERPGRGQPVVHTTQGVSLSPKNCNRELAIL